MSNHIHQGMDGQIFPDQSVGQPAWCQDDSPAQEMDPQKQAPDCPRSSLCREKISPQEIQPAVKLLSRHTASLSDYYSKGPPWILQEARQVTKPCTKVNSFPTGSLLIEPRRLPGDWNNITEQHTENRSIFPIGSQFIKARRLPTE